jgi:hypothetical protein
MATCRLCRQGAGAVSATGSLVRCSTRAAPACCLRASADHARPYDASMIFLQQFVHACLAVARNAATDAGHWTPDAQKSGTPVMHASAHKHTSCCCMSYWVAMNLGASRCVVVDRFQMPLCSAGEESFCAMTTSSRGLLPQSWQSHHII